MSFKKSDLTELELEVVENLEGKDEFNGYPYSCVKDIAEGIGRSTNVTRGVITSLSKKGIVSIEDCVSGCPPSFVLLIDTEEKVEVEFYTQMCSGNTTRKSFFKILDTIDPMLRQHKSQSRNGEIRRFFMTTEDTLAKLQETFKDNDEFQINKINK